MKNSSFNPLEQTMKKQITPLIQQPSLSQQPQTITTYISITPTTNLIKPIISTSQVNKLKFLNISLIVQQNFEVTEELESNWITLKKNMMDLFCNNFNLNVKSEYSVSMNEEDGKKNILK